MIICAATTYAFIGFYTNVLAISVSVYSLDGLCAEWILLTIVIGMQQRICAEGRVSLVVSREHLKLLATWKHSGHILVWTEVNTSLRVGCDVNRLPSRVAAMLEELFGGASFIVEFSESEEIL